MARRHGDHAAEGHILAVAHRRLGDLATALTHHAEAIEASRRVDGMTGELTVLNDAGLDEARARRCRAEAARLYAELGVPPAGDEPQS